MDKQRKLPWNSRARRWNLRWWHVLLILGLFLLWGVVDALVFAYRFPPT